MDALIFFVLAAAAVVGIRKGLAWSRQRGQQRRSELAQLAQKHGWVLDDADPESLRYRLHGTSDGIAWQLATESEAGSSETSTSTKWSTEAVTYADLVGMIWTRKSFDLLKSMWGRAATGLLQAMTSATGLPAPQHSELVREGKQLQPSESEVDENFIVIVRPERGLDGLLTREVEAALRAWNQSAGVEKETLSVDIGQTNLRVYCQHILAPQHIEALVNVGLAVAKSLRR